uniref:Conserved oligomeric Golgi complex subunit 1 n=1 Tax=Strongyloides papillosus TaxID=174720 RepID=A0A0N5BKT5_STREA
MNVERLMIDLDVSQLEKIQEDLTKETNGKKEELRQMVGRRYRDVLDASNTLKLLTDISNKFCNKLSETESYFKSSNSEQCEKFGYDNDKIMKAKFSSKFLAFTSLIPKLPLGDGLSNVYLLLLLEKIYNHLIVEKSVFTSKDVEDVLNESKKRIDNERENVFSKLSDDLGTNQNIKFCCNQLLAIGLLSVTTLDDYKEHFFNSKLESIKQSAATGENITEIVRQIHITIKAYLQIFGHDGFIYSLTSEIKNPNWRPKIVNEIMNDQLYSVTQYLDSLIVNINNSVNIVDRGECSNEEFKKEFEQFITRLSVEVKPLLSERCQSFIDSEGIVDFMQNLVDNLISDFSKITSPKYIYYSLFENNLKQRFYQVMEEELYKFSEKFLEKTKDINLKPQNLFTKWKAKFDELVTTGVSHDLNETIEEFFIYIQSIKNNVNKYSAIDIDDNSSQIYEVFSSHVLGMIQNLCKTLLSIDNCEVDINSIPENSSITDIDFWLDRFRILLGIIQHEPPTLSECMGDDFRKIRECNNILIKSTESCLCIFLNYSIVHIECESGLLVMIQKSKSPMEWLESLQKFEDVSIGESGKIKVPVSLNIYIYNFLSKITYFLNEKGFGHLLTRGTTSHLNKIIGDIILLRMEECIRVCSSSMIILLQLLLDSKILFTMFLNEKFLSVISKIESRINPIDLELASEQITKNSSLFIQKTYMLFGLLQIEQTQGKDVMKSTQGQINITELYPRFEDVDFLPSLPRYTKSKKETSRIRDPEPVDQNIRLVEKFYSFFQ